jgi:hypothetical protein
MLTIPKDVFNTHIAPHLDGREALFLSLACKQLSQWVESNPLLQRYIRWHWIRLGDVSELEPWLELKRSKKKRRFDPSIPWIGEGEQIVDTYHISNFYTKSHDLDVLISDILLDTNKWRFFTYPPLEGSGRWRWGPLSFHRGGSIQLFGINE